MDVIEAINKRRAYRALKEFTVTEEIISELAQAASLAPSCYNNQPWRYVFIYEPEMLEKFYTALSEGNSWAKDGSLIIAVFADRDDDCIAGDREYYLFDSGLGTENLILRATELGLVAHPMAGYDEQKAKDILGIPESKCLITVIGVGRHAEGTKEAEKEKERPERLPEEEFVYHNEVE
ncbi:MAG: nitroreductase family protein [bacterium]